MLFLVTGSREFGNSPFRVYSKDKRLMEDTLIDFSPNSILLEGGARGADILSKEVWSSWGGKYIEIKADWEKYGKAAGPIRNAKMLDLNPEFVIAFLTENSKGTKNCIELARARNIPVRVINV